MTPDRDVLLRQSARYRTIVADPPWDVRRLSSPGAKAFGTQEGTIKSIRLEYSTMPVDEVAALPVEAMAEDDAHLYIWTINAFVEDTYLIARAWGFTPKILLTWGKTPMGLGPGGAYSQTSEFILFARRGRDVVQRRCDTTWWQWPRGRHSAKPDAFLDTVEQVSPGPYLELFARRARFGWDYWGNESFGTAEMPCIACRGKGRRSTWVNELGREVEGACPDCAPTEEAA